MSRIVQARLDDETLQLAEKLKEQTGWTNSELIRQGIHALKLVVPRRKRRIIGLGKFDSGIPDLATNKKHMEGFGK